jgi:plastocyanin
MTRLLPALLAALALGLAACGSGEDEGDAPASASACPEGAVVIAMRDIKFVPEDARAKVGDTVCWPNEEAIQHNAVAESGADFQSELYGEGETFTTKLTEPGTVEYVCTVHPSMTGTIEVTP